MPVESLMRYNEIEPSSLDLSRFTTTTSVGNTSAVIRARKLGILLFDSNPTAKLQSIVQRLTSLVENSSSNEEYKHSMFDSATSMMVIGSIASATQLTPIKELSTFEQRYSGEEEFEDVCRI